MRKHLICLSPQAKKLQILCMFEQALYSISFYSELGFNNFWLQYHSNEASTTDGNDAQQYRDAFSIDFSATDNKHERVLLHVHMSRHRKDYVKVKNLKCPGEMKAFKIKALKDEVLAKVSCGCFHRSVGNAKNLRSDWKRNIKRPVYAKRGDKAIDQEGMVQQISSTLPAFVHSPPLGCSKSKYNILKTIMRLMVSFRCKLRFVSSEAFVSL
uniref:Uncharacterized protein n=1 Tax=Glossina austeni TaxID=7395 RepID=A0A1A9VLQ8_GLOAU